MKFHHAGWVVNDIKSAMERLSDVLGATITAPIAEDPIQKVRLAMIRVGDMEPIELIEPMGEASPALKILEKNGPIVYHVCFEVDDIQAEYHSVRGRGGVALSEPVPAALFGGRLIFFAMYRDLGLLEFLQKKGS